MKNKPVLKIDIAKQRLVLEIGDTLHKEYVISTAKNGPGEIVDSECTPRGKHVICEKFGEGCEPNTVFVGRKATGESYTPELRNQFPERDWILTRILRLSGEEPGFNQGGEVDTYERYIYIHGAPDDVTIGMPGSHGCIRMRNHDVIELFELVDVNTQVLIN